MQKKIIRYFVLPCAAIVLVLLIFWICWGNATPELNMFTLSYADLPRAFDGYRIAHISDLHNAEMGPDNEKLLKMLRDAKPDMIAITGDLIDSRNTDVDVALDFLRRALTIAPCYYVTGNHEARVGAYEQMKEEMLRLGVTVLSDARIEVAKDADTITVMGVDDPAMQDHDDDARFMAEKLDGLEEKEGFVLLLSHRPELFDVYTRYGVDLVLSGHAHGGQFRLPFIGGLVAPNQGFFPKYDCGQYTNDETTMLVSRGIGNSLFPFRVNNRPEVILVELKCNN